MRYDVKLVLTMEYHFAIEAESQDEARTQALDDVSGRDPEKTTIELFIEKGVR